MIKSSQQKSLQYNGNNTNPPFFRHHPDWTGSDLARGAVSTHELYSRSIMEFTEIEISIPLVDIELKQTNECILYNCIILV